MFLYGTGYLLALFLLAAGVLWIKDRISIAWWKTMNLLQRWFGRKEVLMESSLHEMAYLKASKKYEEITMAILKELSAANPSQDSDTVYQVSMRALKLHIESLNFAEKVWARSLPYEKAEASLVEQFHDFPKSICTQALSSAYIQTR